MFSTQWDDDQGAWVYAFSALSADGVALWGSRAVVSGGGPRVLTLPDVAPLYAETLELEMPQPRGNPSTAYSYSVVTGPAGLAVDRASGVVSWRPTLLDVGVPHPVTIRALDTDAGDPDEVRYIFTATAAAATVVNRVDLDFSAEADEGLLDAEGRATGLTARLPGTGSGLPELDPNLRLDAGAGVLELGTTQSDFNGAANLDVNSSPGLALADLGFTGSEDFAVTVRFEPLVGLEFIDQAGLYVGASSNALTRAGTIVFGAPERYSVHSENGGDHSGRFFGFGLDASDGMTVTITRESSIWRYFVDGAEWNPLAPPVFLDGLGELTAGVFAVTPLNANAKTLRIDSFSAVVATLEPKPM